MLSVDGLAAHYGSVAAVQDVSLDVAPGEIVGLVGPNGAGKSTTLRVIVGLMRPTQGTVRFEGEPLVGQPPERIVRRGIALVPEGRQIFSTLSVAENLRLGASIGTARGAATGTVDGVLDRFPVLKRYYDSSAGMLSGGEQQQLAIARALLTDPRLLILDEPSLGLAPIVVDVVFEALAELRREGLTVLLVEQNALRTVAFADRSYVLRNGRVALAGTREELTGQVDLADTYLGAAER